MTAIRGTIFDIDGSVAAQAGPFVAEVTQAIQDLQHRGITVGFATGKNFDHVYGICRGLGIDTQFVASENGGVTHWLLPGQGLPSWEVKVEAPATEIAALARFAQLIELDPIAGTVLIGTERQAYRPELKRSIFTFFPIFKIEETKSFEIFFKELVAKHRLPLHVQRHKDGAIDVCPSSATKVVAFERLESHLGVNREELLVVVDGGNDLELAEASTGPIICPGNDHPSIKKIVLEKGGFVGTGYDGQGFLEGLAHYGLR